MVFFKEKNIMKKILVILLIIFSVRIMYPKEVQADVVELGGKLLSPVMSLLVSCGDGAMNVLHSSIMGVDTSLLELRTDKANERLIRILSRILVVVSVAGAIFLSNLGVGVILGGLILSEIAGYTIFGTNILYKASEAMTRSVVYSITSEDDFPSKLYLPAYSYTPEEIFKGKIGLFNVNFFEEPKTIYASYSIKASSSEDEDKEIGEYAQENTFNGKTYTERNGPRKYRNACIEQITSYISQHEDDFTAWYGEDDPKPGKIDESDDDYQKYLEKWASFVSDRTGQDYIGDVKVYSEKNVSQFEEGFPDSTETSRTPVVAFYYVVDESCTEELEVCDGINSSGGEVSNDEESVVDVAETSRKVHGYVTSKTNSATVLREAISSWYKKLRYICIVMMMCILAYIGIRIIVTSVASDKAKYKELLKDWLVGMVLLFTIHYIMVFSVKMVEKITDVVVTSMDNQDGVYMSTIDINDDTTDSFKKLGFIDEDGNVSPKITDGSEDYYIWSSDLMGYLRVQLQMDTVALQYVGEGLLFLVLVIFTILFTFTYLKRVLYMAFLTMMSPLMAFTYCIDKMKDGSAQGFNGWLKEYIFNLLVQPLHLLLYYMLITTAFDTMGDNIIYSVVAIGFMLPAEKLLRTFFKFQNSNSPGFLNSPVAAGLMTTGINNLIGMAKRNSANGKGASGGKDKENEKSLPNFSSAKLDDVFGRKDNIEEQHGGIQEDEDYASSMQFLIDSQEEEENENPLHARQIQTPQASQVQTSQARQVQTPQAIQVQTPQASQVQTLQASQVQTPLPQTHQIQMPQNEDERLRFRDRARARAGMMFDSAKNSELARRGKRTLKAHKSALSAIGNKGKSKFTTTALKNDFKTLGSGVIKGAKGAAMGTLVGSAAGLTLAAMGVAAGSEKDAIAGLTTGIGTGLIVGKNSSNGSFMPQEAKDAYDRTSNSEEFQDLVKADYINEKRNDTEVRQKFADAFGSRQASEYLQKDGLYAQLIQNGSDDIEDNIALIKLMENGTIGNVKHAAAIADLNKRVGGKDFSKMDDETKEKWYNTVDNILRKTEIPESDIQKTREKTFDFMDQLNKTKKELY